MVAYFYGYLAPVSSELHRFQKGSNHPRRKDKRIPEGRRTNRTDPKSEPKGGPVRQRAGSHFRGDPCIPVRVQDLVESSHREFNLCRKGKVCAAWEVLGERLHFG